MCAHNWIWLKEEPSLGGPRLLWGTAGLLGRTCGHRTSFVGVRPSLGLMFCCHLREILHHFWKRGIYFHFSLGLPIIELVLSGQDSVISSLLLISSWRISLQYCPSGSDRLLALGWGDLVHPGWDLGEARVGGRAQNWRKCSLADVTSALEGDCPWNFAPHFPHLGSPVHSPCAILFSPASFVFENNSVPLWWLNFHQLDQMAPRNLTLWTSSWVFLEVLFVQSLLREKGISSFSARRATVGYTCCPV